MYKRGLVALSADPVHYGHLDLIQIAKLECKHLLVLVANNDEKRNSYLFAKNERINFVRKLLHGMADVEVIESSTEILSDTYLNFGCDVLFRGIRDQKDQVYEETQMKYHKMIYPKLNPIFLKFSGEKSNISSSLVKAFTKHHIDISNYVPIFVKKALEERINNQYKIAVTGGIAVGKSWVTDTLVKTCNDRGVHTTAINFDNLIRLIYEESTPGSIKMRRELEYLCLEAGSQISILNQDGTVNRPVLGRFIFSHPSNDVRIRVQELTQPLVDAKYREALNRAGSGLIIIEWAQLAEMDMGRLTNHNVIVVDSPDRSFFIEQRKISQEDFKNKTKFQWTAEKKSQVLESAARKDGVGHIIQFSNTIQDNKINDLADEVISLFSLGD